MREESRWRRYLRFLGPDIDGDIDDELRFHLEMRERDFIAGGMRADEAREAARARFGNVEEVRRWLHTHDRKRAGRRKRRELLDGWVQDVRYAGRKLVQQPGFTAAVVAVLALGIGATAAIFSAVDAVLLRPLPFAEDSRLVRVNHVAFPVHLPGMEEPKTFPDVTDLDAMGDVFRSQATYAPGSLNLTGGGQPMRVSVGVVTPSFFPTLGASPYLGRTFRPDEGAQGAEPVAILSHGLWRRHFGASADALGGSVALNGKEYRVIGVMPPGFSFPSDAAVWIPLLLPATFADFEPFRQFLPSSVVARLAPGISLTLAEERLRSMMLSYPAAERYLESAANAEVVQPLRETLVADRRRALLVLFGATTLVLLVACANVANLLLSRAAARRQEIAVRAVLGASPARILRQLMIESLVLAGMGGALGIALAYASLGPLRTLIPAALAGAASLQIDARVLVFTVLTVLVTGIAFGLWPALGARRTEPGEVIKGGGSGGATGADPARLRRAIVVGEVALTLMLLIGAGVMLRSFRALVTTETGLEPERVATLELSLVRASYGTPAARREFLESMLERLQANPQIEAAAFVNELPLRGPGGISMAVQAEGQPPVRPEDAVYAQDLRVTPDYFHALGIRMLAGRTFSTATDTIAARQMVINEELARRLWPGENAVGKRVVFTDRSEPYEVLGVVANVRWRSLDEEANPQMYFPLLATPYQHLALVARGRVPPRTLASWLQEAVHSVAPDQAVYNVRTMEEVISGTVAPRRTNTILITLFGLLALVLAAVGVYGVIAFSVARRTREIGIRMALGARPSAVMREVLREGMVLVAVGITTGLIAAWILARVLASLAYGVGPRDPVSFLVAPLLLLAVAAVATLLPARRATRVDPMLALRDE